MKVTIGLNNKLKNEFNEQTETMLKPLYLKKQEREEILIDATIKELTEAVTKYPCVKTIIAQSSFRCNVDNIAETVKHNSDFFLSREDMKDINTEISTIRNKRKKEFEVIMIELTYGKDISDIKTIFEKYKLNF